MDAIAAPVPVSDIGHTLAAQGPAVRINATENFNTARDWKPFPIIEFEDDPDSSFMYTTPLKKSLFRIIAIFIIVIVIVIIIVLVTSHAGGQVRCHQPERRVAVLYAQRSGVPQYAAQADSTARKRDLHSECLGVLRQWEDDESLQPSAASSTCRRRLCKPESLQLEHFWPSGCWHRRVCPWALRSAAVPSRRSGICAG